MMVPPCTHRPANRRRHGGQAGADLKRFAARLGCPRGRMNFVLIFAEGTFRSLGPRDHLYFQEIASR